LFNAFKIVTSFEAFSVPNFVNFVVHLKAENNLSVPAEKAIAVWNCATKSNVIILILFFSASHHVIGLTYLMASSDKFRMEFLLGSI